MKVYIDIDGVLANLDKYCEEYELNPKDYAHFFGTMESTRGFLYLKPLPFGKCYNLLNASKVEINILGSFGREDNVNIFKDKKYWLKQLPYNFNNVYLVPGRAYKKWFTQPGDILIDDTLENINDWNKMGGIGILHTAENITLEALKLYLK